MGWPRSKIAWRNRLRKRFTDQTGLTEYTTGPFEAWLVAEKVLEDSDAHDALLLAIEKAAEWRRTEAVKYPDDERHIKAASQLDQLAQEVTLCSGELIVAYAVALNDHEDWIFKVVQSCMLAEVGFSTSPASIDDLVRSIVTGVPPGAA